MKGVITPSLLRSLGVNIGGHKSHMQAAIRDASRKDGRDQAIGGASEPNGDPAEKPTNQYRNESPAFTERVVTAAARMNIPAPDAPPVPKAPQDPQKPTAPPAPKLTKSAGRALRYTDAGPLIDAALTDRLQADTAIMMDADAHPLALLIAMMKWFGRGSLEWEPETLWEELALMGVSRIPQVVKDKFMAIRGAHRINDFYSNFRSFEILGNALNGVIPDFNHLQPITMPQVLNTVKILAQIRTDDEYQPEVCAYIKAIANQEGFAVLPEELHFVEKPEWPDFYNDVRDRHIVLLQTPEHFNINSAVDGQAIKFAECYSYAVGQELKFSEDVNKYFEGVQL